MLRCLHTIKGIEEHSNLHSLTSVSSVRQSENQQKYHHCFVSAKTLLRVLCCRVKAESILFAINNALDYLL